MKYRALAKAFQFVKGSTIDPVREDAIWLTGGEKKKFTDKQLDKLNICFADLVGKAQEKLESQGIDFEAMLKHMPKNGTAVPTDSTRVESEDD
jgi:hypothetical protein